MTTTCYCTYCLLLCLLQYRNYTTYYLLPSTYYLLPGTSTVPYCTPHALDVASEGLIEQKPTTSTHTVQYCTFYSILDLLPDLLPTTCYLQYYLLPTTVLYLPRVRVPTTYSTTVA